MSIAEALTAGVPVVATKGSGWADLHTGCGYTVSMTPRDCGRHLRVLDDADASAMRARVNGLGKPCVELGCACHARRVRKSAMTWRSILLTPNVLGKDGVSALSREMARALPSPALIVSLHDDSRTPDFSPVGIEVRGANGSRLAFIAAALNAARHAGSETVVVCSHLHLAPVAKCVSVVIGARGRP
jgi:hypothetical protein